jgi:hypothetical protein
MLPVKPHIPEVGLDARQVMVNLGGVELALELDLRLLARNLLHNLVLNSAGMNTRVPANVAHWGSRMHCMPMCSRVMLPAKGKCQTQRVKHSLFPFDWIIWKRASP